MGLPIVVHWPGSQPPLDAWLDTIERVQACFRKMKRTPQIARGPAQYFSKTDLGKLLQRSRAGKPINIIPGGFHSDALRAYECGNEIPPAAAVESLAASYGADLYQTRAAYISSIAQMAKSPLPLNMLAYTLNSATNHDHLVVVAQHSILSDEMEAFATPLYRLLKNGGSLTSVAYRRSCGKTRWNPANEIDRLNDCWKCNHYQVARAVEEKLLISNHETKERINFLSIGNPTLRDLAFLSPRGAIIYLCRHESKTENDILSSHAWSQSGNREGEIWFTPCNASTISDLRNWLATDCGLKLPDPSYKASARSVKRNVQYRSLLQVLSHRND